MSLTINTRSPELQDIPIGTFIQTMRNLGLEVHIACTPLPPETVPTVYRCTGCGFETRQQELMMLHSCEITDAPFTITES